MRRKYGRIRPVLLGLAAALAACAGPQDPMPSAQPDDRGRYTELMRKAMATNDTADWRTVEREAAGRRDTQAMCVAKLNRIICLSNFSSAELAVAEARRELPDILAFGRYTTYFTVYRLLVDCLAQQQLYDDARREAEAMSEQADLLDCPNGKAMSLLVQGTLYCKLGLYGRAYAALDEGLRICPPYGVPDNQSGTTYRLLCEWGVITAFRAGDYERISVYAPLYGEYVQWHGRTGMPDPTGHYKVTALAFEAMTLLGRGRYPEAQALLDEAAGSIRPDIPARAYEHFYEARRELRSIQGDYEGAVADADTLLSTHRDYYPFRLDDMLRKARLLGMAGRTGESADVYSDYIRAADSVNRVDIAGRLDRLRTLYEVDKLETERRLSQHRTTGALVACLLLGMLLASYVVYSRRLREKNRALYRRIREGEHLETEVEQVIRSLPEENLSRDLRLFMRLNELLRSEELYTDPALSRDELAARLGTNRTYLSDAVRACTDGLTVRQYLNHIRLKHAGRLLAESDAVQVDSVCADCGFTSRSVFFRLFREQYGMSPARFRDLSVKG